MLDYMKKRNSKGFTLAELLVVVAIIAILVAVSIPMFSGKLQEVSKQTDFANIRAAKAVAINNFLQDDSMQQELAQSNKKTKQLVRFYNAETGALVDAKEAKALKPYNKFKWNLTVPKGSSIIIIFIQEDKASTADEDNSIRVNYAWIEPSDVSRFE